MTRKAPKAPHLASLLDQHRDEIAANWADMARNLPGARYARYPVEEIRSWLQQGVTAAIDSLSNGSYEPAEAYLREITLARLQMGFDIAEVTEGLLLLREAARPILQRAYESDLRETGDVGTAWDTYLRFLVGRFGFLYAERMEADLRQSEERFRTLADFTYDWEYWLNPDGVYVYVSPSCERITGYTPEEFRQNPELLASIVHPADRAAIVPQLRGEPDGSTAVRREQFRIIARDGEVRWLEHISRPVHGFSERNPGRRGSIRDITERRRAEQALEEQAREKAVATERSRLARELHDSVTQALYSVTLYAEAARLALDADKRDVATENVLELHNMAREAMVDMRMLIFELHPPVVEEEGLVAALQTRLAAVEGRARLKTELRVEGERRLPIQVEEELFRIALEALNNVLKHAHAQQVTVTLGFEDTAVRLQISDDGDGLDPVAARHGGGLGLRGMEQRAERIQGVLTITSEPGKGTTLNVLVPNTAGEDQDLSAS